MQSFTLITNILDRMDSLSVTRKRFILSVFSLFLSLRGRYTFKGFERYGSYCEKSYRLGFESTFDFLDFNIHLIKEHSSMDCIIAFDPSYIPKSGKHTPHMGTFYNGCLGKAIRGMEIGGLGVIDLKNNTAFPLEAVSTPNPKVLKSKGMSLVDHYAKIILERSKKLEQLSKHIVVDAYFSKSSFIKPILEHTQLHIISKLRKDANLKYLHDSDPSKKKGRGRPKKFDAKIDLKNIDRNRFKLDYQDEQVILYQLKVWSVFLKQTINLVYALFKDKNQETERYAVFFSTDLKLDAYTIYTYYKARFQIEFLFRDAKQHTGLTQCQARSKNKLYFHFNTSLTTIGIAKAAYHIKNRKARDKPFSMANIKTLNFNNLMYNLFLSSFQNPTEIPKNKRNQQKILNLGIIAA